jgi:ubiquinone/menaquinone biosynthesis C-methylase UbiE
VREYYDRRAEEYDETSYGEADEAESREVAELAEAIAGLVPTSTLDVGCGTGFLTRYLPGEVVGLDQSHRMLLRARARLGTSVPLLRADGTRLPFPDRAFGRLFASHVYDHLEEPDRLAFQEESRRVGEELVLVVQREVPGVPADGFEERPLRDGSTHLVYKRYFTPERLLAELGGGALELEGRTFLCVRSPG